MDDLDLKGVELKKVLQDLDKVNRWLGGNKITIDGIKILLKNAIFDSPLRIIDVGCGNGSLLKEVAEFGHRRGIKMELTGIDLNPNSVEIARENTADYPEIKFEALDVFSEAFSGKKVDIILCTLTLHHFKDDEIKALLKVFVQVCQIGVVINDLQRTKAAYYLFQGFSRAFNLSKINRKDGLTSILRSFKKEDFEEFSRELPVTNQILSWKWAFRYQWILIK